jgi:hypothetical protein
MSSRTANKLSCSFWFADLLAAIEHSAADAATKEEQPRKGTKSTKQESCFLLCLLCLFVAIKIFDKMSDSDRVQCKEPRENSLRSLCSLAAKPAVLALVQSA